MRTIWSIVKFQTSLNLLDFFQLITVFHHHRNIHTHIPFSKSSCINQLKSYETKLILQLTRIHWTWSWSLLNCKYIILVHSIVWHFILSHNTLKKIIRLKLIHYLINKFKLLLFELLLPNKTFFQNPPYFVIYARVTISK